MADIRPAICGLSLVVLCGAPGGVAGQVINVQQTQQQTTQGPARDRPTAQTGTAVVRGRVFAIDTGRPLRRAKIALSAPELGPEGRTTSTGTDGRYEIKDLPAGRYSMQVTRAGYLMLRYGQRRPLEQGKPLQLLDKQLLDNVDFSLPRMSLITGRITDEVGEPIAGAVVYAMRSTYFEGRKRLVPAGVPSVSDDAGQYRLLGLVPGTYFVMATMRDTWTVTEGGVEETLGYAPTYFSGTTATSDARRVTLGVGQEAAATDFSLIPGRVARISGTIVDSQGRPGVGQNVSLAQEMRGPGSVSMFMSSGSPVAADGSFTMKNVAPGGYKLVARVSTPGKVPGTQVQEAAAQALDVSGVDIDNLVLVTSSGWSASGQVTDERGGVPGLARDRIRIVARPLSGDSDPRLGNLTPDNGRVKDDWTFAVGGVFGPSRIRVTLPDGWMVKAILHDGRDVADQTFDLKSGEDLSGLQVLISNNVTTVTGQLTDDKGAALSDGTVIIFAADAEKWAEDSRFVRSARPDQQGQYQIKGLPPGDYLAVAVDYVQEGMWNDPEYLESLRRYGQKLTLADGATQPISLKIVAP